VQNGCDLWIFPARNGGKIIEIVGHNTAKLRLDERIYEVISIIKPTHMTEPYNFLEGNLWVTRKGFYNDKLVNRVYHLINHHIYSTYKMDGPTECATYWLVSGRGNINEITYEKACALVNERVGYVEDSDLAVKFGPNDEPAIPYEVNQDW
jgi:hypothetical protein